MSFSADWLALREPADHAARSKSLLAEVAGHFAGREAISVVDLGCGAGSNLRGTAQALPDRQYWRLVDYDPKLLAAARGRLTAWADGASSDGDVLVLAKGAKSLRVTFTQADLNTDLDRVLAPSADLVTAAALFDLVSATWIERFVAALALRRLPLYTVLTYDGTDAWTPPHPADQAMLQAFHAHQATDKGFGPAAGPQATAIMAAAFAKAGYAIRQAPSPWHVGADLAALGRQLVAGFAGAVGETGRLSQAEIDAWLAARLSGVACEVGHQDLFAIPR
ncbi:class I SAM-dependent methyltransferase [Phreatobacter stygius]|uniref:Class I SAM-dependent methyltransferase n=1 Tax=Phreatobacter stygius TaxID=1940610 RepID=A0A4D7AWD4_9HYPH|nr:class I SAM-dependent methyltransferase [Phreatobacter stygius]QCI64271.1 class I SAM-dependent methyltransferase [Phreatobacter stygius]